MWKKMERAVFLCTLFISTLYMFASESHRLVFLSTGFVKSQSRSHYHFEQLTVYDGVAVSFCDGETQKEQLKPKVQTSTIPDNCKTAYYDMIEAVSDIQSRTSAVDVQRRRGCVLSSNGTVSAFEVWAVNGSEFVTFDPDTLKWTPQSPSALQVKEFWDSQQIWSHDFSDFLRNICPEMIQQITLKSTPKNTDLHIFAKLVENNEALLLCHVTTTDPSVKSVRWTGDGASRVSGSSVVGPLPSGGDGWILRLTARISLVPNNLTYGCAVQSESSSFSVNWDGTTLDGRQIYYTVWYKSPAAISGYIIVPILFICAVIFCLYIMKKRNCLPCVFHGSNTPDHNRGNNHQGVKIEHLNGDDPNIKLH